MSHSEFYVHGWRWITVSLRKRRSDKLRRDDLERMEFTCIATDMALIPDFQMSVSHFNSRGYKFREGK